MPGSNPRKLSFQQLDAEIDKKAVPFKRNLAALIPYLRAMRELLRDPGKRNDLPDAAAKPTWAEWKESKRKKIGLAPRTIDLLLETGRTTSKTSGKNGTCRTHHCSHAPDRSSAPCHLSATRLSGINWRNSAPRKGAGLR